MFSQEGLFFRSRPGEIFFYIVSAISALIINKGWPAWHAMSVAAPWHDARHNNITVSCYWKWNLTNKSIARIARLYRCIWAPEKWKCTRDTRLVMPLVRCRSNKIVFSAIDKNCVFKLHLILSCRWITVLMSPLNGIIEKKFADLIVKHLSLNLRRCFVQHNSGAWWHDHRSSLFTKGQISVW